MTTLPTKPAHRAVLALAVPFIALGLFLILAANISNRPIFFDTAIQHWIHAHSTHFYDTLFLAITSLGSVQILGPLTLLTAVYLWYKRQGSNALIVSLGVVGASATNILLKHLFHRHRPGLWHSAITETGYSFPSGHAMLSCAFALSIIAISWHSRWRPLAVLCGILFVIGVGYSRVYLGVHYPSDVIAGWSASIGWVAVILSFIRRRL